MPRPTALLVLLLTLLAAMPARAADDGNVLIVAGGCFWCVESDFDHVPGVLETVSGYTGGHLDNPTYEQVSHGGTGHLEAVRIRFDPAKTSYAKLVEVFWRTIDPTDAGGQFCDRGHSYTTAIFPLDAEQRRIAEASKNKLDESGKLGAPIATKILDAGPFYPAEGYHQDFYTKSPIRYRFYRFNCGRDNRVDQLWGTEARKGLEFH
jgi:peptide-methionine (S)-S-oxide reductase